MYAFDLSDRETNTNPFPAFTRLREYDPVHWSPAMKAWILTRYDDVRAMALNNTDFSADRLTPFFRAHRHERGSVAALAQYLTHWMVFRDPPDHTRLRRVFTRVFTNASVDAMRTKIEATIARLFEAMDAKAAAAETVDWIAEFAYPLPATVIMDVLGVPRGDLAAVKRWSDDIALFIGSAQEAADKYARAESGAKAMAEYFRNLIDRRKIDPQDDLMSRLIAAQDERESLNEDETIGTCILLLFAGHETTTNLIGNGLYYSLEFREEWERLCGDPSLVEPAVEEWLRYDGPSAAIARVVSRDTEFQSVSLRAGQRVFAFLNAANRDPEAFEDAERFDVGRCPNPHLTFGHGIHFCLGAPLARLEARLALARLVERYPEIRLAGGTPEWHDSLILRGMKALPVRLR